MKLFLKKISQFVYLLFCCAVSAQASPAIVPQKSSTAFYQIADQMLRYSTEAWLNNSPSNYLHTYFGATIGINESTGWGLTNVPYFGLTNQIPTFGISNIPVYVNGTFVYSPAINRILQLAANICEATTNAPNPSPAFFPSVFRPIFERDNLRNVYIVGYQQITNVAGINDVVFSRPYDIETLTNYATANTPIVDGSGNYLNVYNVPWIIGARKGFPNFNNFAEENIVSINRRVQLSRLTNSPVVTITGTNQLYMFGASVNLGVNLWNSYVSNYMGNVLGQVYVSLAMAVTNDAGLRQQLPFFETNSVIAVANWPGSGAALALAGTPNPSSIWFNYWTPQFLTNVVYRTATAPADTVGSSGISLPGFLATNAFAFSGVTQVFETNNPNFSMPHFGETITNHLQVFMISPNNEGTFQVIDYVQLSDRSSRDLNAEIFTTNVNDVWNTNYGVLNQIYVSRGLRPVPAADGLWNADPQALTLGTSITNQQAVFDLFFAPYGTMRQVGTKQVSNPLDVVQAPYSPTRYAIHYTSWEANDPLVHYLINDLNRLVTNSGIFNAPTQIPSVTNLDLTTLNRNYNPWGGNPYMYNAGHSDTFLGSGNETNRYTYWLKDPLISSSDIWNFPTNPATDFNWLGRVHRGTPWQTVYLKSFDVLNGFADGQGQLIWQQWSGNPDRYDANNSAPEWDWYLAGLLTSLFNTNPVEQTISVNNTNIASWQSVLNGLVALTNSQPGITDALIISSNLDQALFIANSIQSIRASQTQGSFDEIGAILSVPALSDQSPFLNISTSANIPSDDADEAIPSQLLPLLRVDARGTMAFARDQLTAQFTGWSGHTYMIQSSTNLVDWTNVSTNYILGGNFSYTNPPNAGHGSQFYRAWLQP